MKSMFRKMQDRRALTRNTQISLIVIITSWLIIVGGLSYIIYNSANFSASSSQEVVINGAGATFPFPMLQTWIDVYTQQNPSVKINYASIGSGGGVRQIQNKTIDFGASDAPLNDEEYDSMPGILHIPEVIGAVVIAYNLKDSAGNRIEDLKMNGTVIANIFMGKITRWNDPAIAAHNPGITLPDEPIIPVRRSDGSGTTFIFTEYLSKVSTEWNRTIGFGKAVQWPKGIAGAKGNEGVTASIIQNDGAIGYIELSYFLANQDQLSVVHVQNRAGNYIEPTEDSVAEAARAFAVKGLLPRGNESWTGVSITDPPAETGVNAYPIASLTYILIYRDLNNVKDIITAQALVDFLWWIIHEGQRHVGSKNDGVPGFVPLPEEIVKINEETLKMVCYKFIR